MKFTTPWNIGVTGETTVELSMANDGEREKLAKHFERNGIVCAISGHWLQASPHWVTVLDVLRSLIPAPVPPQTRCRRQIRTERLEIRAIPVSAWPLISRLRIDRSNGNRVFD